jgi:flagellar basal body rod protein FlgB
VCAAEDVARRGVSSPAQSDGNNVQLDQELLAMSQNSVEYNYLTEIVGG